MSCKELIKSHITYCCLVFDASCMAEGEGGNGMACREARVPGAMGRARGRGTL